MTTCATDYVTFGWSNAVPLNLTKEYASVGLCKVLGRVGMQYLNTCGARNQWLNTWEGMKGWELVVELMWYPQSFWETSVSVQFFFVFRKDLSRWKQRLGAEGQLSHCHHQKCFPPVASITKHARSATTVPLAIATAHLLLARKVNHGALVIGHAPMDRQKLPGHRYGGFGLQKR